ncbi:disulfide bond formation protein B [Salinarimonas soli]|uniref:Disulfide bond formation protein B n=1 Tax=Salinarimonas soli TaxID=1638099 RepID=A0A5B2V726_9HYPH|nr:disulfide bond formation protein B [Salinarimonas soli]KAA2234365.1 disulfide bond formation protein B [Salinarimonas soli]
MTPSHRRLLSIETVALLVLVVGGATILGALYFEHVVGLRPCKLCLQQRWPYYAGLPVAALALLAAWRGAVSPARAALGLAAVIFLAGAGLGAYHAGVEWGFWAGPSDCGGASALAAGMGDFLRQLQTVRVVSCTEAAWRFLGVSMAGWNAMISLGLATMSAAAAIRARRGRA